jgi:hypothetical protein
MMSPDATPRRCFTRDYALGCSAAVRDLERSVLGCDYGATSWTTRDEAAAVADLLGLRPRVRLLDVGAGAGWPGLYLSLRGAGAGRIRRRFGLEITKMFGPLSLASTAVSRLQFHDLARPTL